MRCIPKSGTVCLLQCLRKATRFLCTLSGSVCTNTHTHAPDTHTRVCVVYVCVRVCVHVFIYADIRGQVRVYAYFYSCTHVPLYMIIGV